MKKILLIAVITLALTALSLTGCDDGNGKDTHTHEWEWVETAPATPTAEGLETETCKTCGATNGTRPIAKLPNPNQTAITAFGKTATVIGDASIPAEDFNAAVGSLESALVWAQGGIDQLAQVEKNGFAAMMSRTITIVLGDAAPAGIDGALTVGIDYLKSNDARTIGRAILRIAGDGGFADPTANIKEF